MGRVVLYDKRGVGLSDRPAEPTTVETAVADLVAVLDACGSRRAVLFSWLHEGVTALATAALHPGRVEAVVAGELLASFTPDPEHPWGYDPALVDRLATVIASGEWGEAAYLRALAPEMADDERLLAWWRRMERLSTSPSGAARLLRSIMAMDARPYLSAV